MNRRDLLAAGYALLLVCIGAIGIGMPRPAPRPKPDFSLTGWQQGQTELDALFTADTEHLKTHPPGDAAENVIIAYERLGQIESEKSSSDQKKRLEKATIAAANAAIDYWFTAGEDAWRGLGVFLVLRFEKALDRVLAARDVDGATLSRWLVNHHDHPLTRRLRETSGTFVEFALGSGLLDEKGYLAGRSPALLRLHFQGRWYLLIQSLRDYMQLYRREELLAKWRWSLEGDRNLSMNKRLEKARQIREHDPEYPVYASLGALYAKRGQTLLAIDAYRNALLEDPFNRTLAKNLNFLVLSQQH
ncbi:MAG: hypothetical protein VX223_08800 [Myxococcota bacterium]|nr:hypothetical protein [Myxococcota bacterium]